MSRRLRSRTVPLGAVAALASALLAGCAQDEATAHCVAERVDASGRPEFQKVDDGRCDGSDGSTWIVYSSTYPRGYHKGESIPADRLGTRVRASDAAAREAHGFSRTGSFPARGGFGGRASGGGS